MPAPLLCECHGLPIPWFVMDMMSIIRLERCNKECIRIVSEVLLDAARRSDEGVILVHHVDEDGKEIKIVQVLETGEVYETDPASTSLQQQQAIFEQFALDNMCSGQGHAHMCVHVCECTFVAMHA